MASTTNAAIDAQALAWFSRREGGLSAGEEQEFQMWLAADPRHVESYAELDEVWELTGELAHGVGAAPRTKPAISLRRSWLRRWVPVTLAAAAGVAIAIFVLRPRVDSGLVHYTIATEVGGLKKLELPDGSVVRLNADTQVTVDLLPQERRVDLMRGEAHFEVAKNTRRPFIVTARGVSVRAVGTAFNVNLKSESLEVIVTEGAVQVQEKGRSVLSSPSGEPVLAAGQKVVVQLQAAATASQPTVVAVPPPVVAQTLAWQAKQLEFDDRPLRDIVAEFNRYNQHQLVLRDDALASRTFGGTFRADDYGTFVELLEKRFDVIAERSGQQTILRLRK